MIKRKKIFLEHLNEMVRVIPSNKKLFIGGDFDGHVGSNLIGYNDVNGGNRFGVRNVEGVSLLKFS